MILQQNIRAAGSFLVIADDLDAEVPDFQAGLLHVWSTQWNIGVATRVDADGETQLSVGDEDMPVDGLNDVFDGVIEAPNLRVTVTDAHLTEYAAVSVTAKRAQVTIWTNHPREPDRIVIRIR